MIATSIPQRGGGAFLDRHKLPYVRSGHHQDKLYLGSMSKYKRQSVSVYNMFTVMLVITFMVALCRNGQSCTLSPQLVLVCKFNAHDAQTKGTLAQFDSPGQSLVENSFSHGMIITSSGQNLSVKLQNYTFRQNSHVGKYRLDPSSVCSF